jgi:uncharacterized membrane protein
VFPLRSPRNTDSRICVQGRHVVGELLDVVVADPIGLIELGRRSICSPCAEKLRGSGLIVESLGAAE